MSSINKIYGTEKQYREFYKWCEEFKPDILKYFVAKKDLLDYNFKPIASFPEEADKWLLNHCPIEWVTDRIKYQYGV